MGELTEGMLAPAFTLDTAGGKRVSLSEFKGKKRVVLYFYPKDDTSGCTAEACGFRDRGKAISGAGAVVLGVSPDSPESHEKFARKYGLDFRLLSDPRREALEAYGVWVKKSMYGRQYMGVERSTFVIGKDGRIEKVFRKVKAARHPEDILRYLKGA